MDQPRTIIDKVAWIPVRNRRVLFARSKKEPKLFYCVGGKRERKPDGAMENDTEALLREVEEEADVLLDAETIRHVKTFSGVSHGHPEGTQLKIACYDAQCRGIPAPANEVEELAWFNSADSYRTTAVGKEILAWCKEQGLID